jgi:plasmid maintenance system antidote protein VapI
MKTNRVRVDSYTNRYLDQVIEHLKLPSDYALAAALHVTTQAVSKMRAGGAMSITTAAKIAVILDLDPLQVIAESELERGSADAEFWERIAKKVAMVAIAVGAASFGVVPSPAEASPQLCIMSNRFWRRFDRILGVPL